MTYERVSRRVLRQPYHECDQHRTEVVERLKGSQQKGNQRMRKVVIVDEVNGMRHVLRDAIRHRVVDGRESIDGPRDDGGRNAREGSEKHRNSIY